MASLLRSSLRVTRARVPFAYISQPTRWASSSYGNKQSGHQEGINEPNPKAHLEHPGPESPAAQGKTQSSSAGSSSSSSSSGGGDSQPKIHSPKSAAEETDPEVKKHNEELRQRPDRSANQLGEEDNKVDKKFWKGDVGDIDPKDTKA